MCIRVREEQPAAPLDCNGHSAAGGEGVWSRDVLGQAAAAQEDPPSPGGVGGGVLQPRPVVRRLASVGASVSQCGHRASVQTRTA